MGPTVQRHAAACVGASPGHGADARRDSNHEVLGHEYAFTDKDFQHIRRIIHELAGIHLGDQKQDLVYSRIARRIRKLGLKSFGEYCALLEAGDERERSACVNALTTNTTYFFREKHHFDYLVQQATARKRWRIWSAGCSSGEEPYSIAMAMHKAMANNAGMDVSILATDLNSEVLDVAQQGVYPIDLTKDIPHQKRKDWFLHGTGSHDGQVLVKPELKALITFRQMNLMHPWPHKEGFDAIFCRNVTIYFDPPTRKKLFQRFADQLVPGGLLFIGHSETLHHVSDRFDLVAQTTYRKKG